MSTTQPAAASVSIRACEAGDVAAITKIYAHHVLHGLASFETEPPSENDMRQRRFGIVSRGFPYLVPMRRRGRRLRLCVAIPPAAGLLPYR